jgi:hypothetical protein
MVSLERTDPVASGQFISKRARLTAKSSAIGCLVVVSGVVLHPVIAANVIVNKENSDRDVVMRTTICRITGRRGTEEENARVYLHERSGRAGHETSPPRRAALTKSVLAPGLRRRG